MWEFFKDSIDLLKARRALKKASRTSSSSTGKKKRAGVGWLASLPAIPTAVVIALVVFGVIGLGLLFYALAPEPEWITSLPQLSQKESVTEVASGIPWLPIAFVMALILGAFFLYRRFAPSTGRKPATVKVAAKRSGGGGAWISQFLGSIFAIGVLIVVTAALAMVFSAVYQAYEGGHEGPVAWTDGSLSATGYEAAKDGIGVIPVSSGQRVTITAQVTFWDQIPHTLKRWRDGFFTNKLGIVTYTEPATVQKTASLRCAPGVTCYFCVTSNIPRPEQGGDWRFRIRDRNGNAAYYTPTPGEWFSLSLNPVTADYRGNVMGTWYISGGQKPAGTCVR